MSKGSSSQYPTISRDPKVKLVPKCLWFDLDVYTQRKQSMHVKKNYENFIPINLNVVSGEDKISSWFDLFF